MSLAPEDRDRLGSLPRERPCPSCGHSFHVQRCRADLIGDVLCPCRCPAPGLDF